ncbi:MAG: lactonase family protein [Chlorobi bacterium]|nr:lactonase family protein [Chlorobiota bacterium]
MELKKVFFAVFFVLIYINVYAVKIPAHSVVLYIGTFTDESEGGLYICTFDTVTGAIENIGLAQSMNNPNFLTISNDKRFLYACVRPQDDSAGSAVEAYKVNRATGSLAFINKKLTTGDDPCYIDITPDGKIIAVANYGGGNLTIFHTNEDGSLTDVVQSLEHKGSGPVKGRQQKAHAHSVRFSPFGNQVFAADLGIDKLMCYRLDQAEGKLLEGSQPFVKLAPGAGPRHFDFLPGGRTIYVVNELNSTVSVLEEKGDSYKVVQAIKTIPDDYSGENYCADIHVSPNGDFLYCSNRGHNSITTFSIAKDGLLSFVGTTPAHGDWPRNFTLWPSGEFMLVANQKSGNITVYRIDKETGMPVFINVNVNVPSPVCLVFL